MRRIYRPAVAASTSVSSISPACLLPFHMCDTCCGEDRQILKSLLRCTQSEFRQVSQKWLWPDVISYSSSSTRPPWNSSQLGSSQKHFFFHVEDVALHNIPAHVLHLPVFLSLASGCPDAMRVKSTAQCPRCALFSRAGSVMSGVVRLGMQRLKPT